MEIRKFSLKILESQKKNAARIGFELSEFVQNMFQQSHDTRKEILLIHRVPFFLLRQLCELLAGF